MSESGSVAEFREAELPKQAERQPRYLATTFIEKTILPIYFLAFTTIISLNEYIPNLALSENANNSRNISIETSLRQG